MRHSTKRIANIFARVCALFCVVVLTFSFSGCSDGETSDAIIDSGITYTVHYVKTPKGSTVEMWSFDQEIPESELEEAKQYQQRNYPNVTVLRDPTDKYNCHSYAWYSTSASNTYWLNDPTPYMTDGSYTSITSTRDFTQIPSSVSNNAKIVWWSSSGEPIHSGIKYNSTTVVSKWGMAGLYRHAQDYTPYSSSASTLEYYK